MYSNLEYSYIYTYLLNTFLSIFHSQLMTTFIYCRYVIVTKPINITIYFIKCELYSKYFK
jgi:hypothetical protein